MDFRILGSLEVWDGERQLELGGPKRRALLAYLTLHANEVVAVDRLLDQLWGEKAPRNAAGALHTHVSRLRKELGTEVLATRAWGYVLRINPGELDLHRFEHLVADAESLPARERAAKLREALALWRGPPLADLAFEPSLVGSIARLEELRVTVLENRIDADLEAGNHDGLAAELEALIPEHPLRERLRGQLILALYRSGRQAEALEVYRETRRVLVEELGIEPSPELKELERAILRHDPALASPATAPQPAEPEVPPGRWHWPRSPLAIGAGLLLLAGAGVAGAVLVPAGSQNATAAKAGGTKPLTVGALFSLPLTTHVFRETSEKQTTQTEQRPVATSTRERTVTTVASTQPTTTHAQRPKPKPPAPTLLRLADTFDGPTTNDRLWVYSSFGTGVDLKQVGGHLELTISADTVPDPRFNATSIGYRTACSFTGDFDMRVDFDLLDWPAASGAVAGLDVDWDGGNMNLLRTSETNGQEQYHFAAQTGEFRGLTTSDSNGGLRMKRAGAVITSYLQRSGHWVEFASARHAGAVRLQTLLWASGTNFSHVQVRAAFDNFVVLTPESWCV